MPQQKNTLIVNEDSAVLVDNVVVEEGGKWFVKSKAGKSLGGPYDSKEEATTRLAEVEMFKHMKANSLESFTTNLKAIKITHNTLEGRPHLVVPMVMLVRGVVPGSQGPLFYGDDELGKTPAVWNYKPIVVYHPTMNGQPISACDPTVINSRKVGVILNTKYEKKSGKLVAEAWLEEGRLGEVDDRVLNAIMKGEPVEVSTGLFTDNEEVDGEWQGKKYTAIAHNFRPDHLAILPDLKGACSLEDGAGLLRNEAESVTDKLSPNQRAIVQMAVEIIQNEMSHSDVNMALAKLVPQDVSNPLGMVWVVDVFDSYFVYDKAGKLFQQSYKKDGDTLKLEGLPTEVVRVMRYQTPDGKLVGNQTGKDNDMDKKQLVDSLISNKATAWAEADRDTLMAMDEKILAKLAPVDNVAMPSGMDAVEWAKMTPEEKKAAADKVKKPAANAADTQPAPVAEPSVDQYIANAPAGIRDVLQNSLQIHEAEKAKTIAIITANKLNTFTADQLKGKPLGELKAIAALAAPAPKPAVNYGGAAEPAVQNGVVTEEPLVPPVMNFSRK